MGSTVSVTTPDGTFNAYLAESATKPAPSVVVIQEAFGVNADLRATCDELAAKGFNAISPDLYWRQEPGLDLSPATDWDRGIALYTALNLDKAVEDVQATVAFARKQPWNTGSVGVMGFCLGGLLTYLAAVRGGVDAGVCYYGGRTGEFLGEAEKLDGPIMLHMGSLDEFIPPEDQAAIQKKLRPLGAEVFIYEGRSHAFARHMGTHYDDVAANLANQRTYDFLKKNLHT